MKRIGLQQRRGRLVQQEDNVVMGAQDAGLRLRVHIALYGRADGLGLIGAGGKQEHAAGVHDAANAQADRLTGHVVFTVEEAAVGLDGAMRKVDDVAAIHKRVGRLVKADVAVAANAKNLDINAACLGNGFIIAGAFRLLVGGVAVGDMGAGRVDVDMIEQLGLHKAVIALLVLNRQSAVLIQVKGLRLGEIQHAGLAQANQFLIGGNRGGAGGQAQHGGGLGKHLRGNQGCGGLSHLGGIFVNMNLHTVPSLTNPICISENG